MFTIQKCFLKPAWTLRHRVKMAVDKQRILSAVSGLQLYDDVLDISIMMSHPVSKFEVERTSGLLEINCHFVDGFCFLLNHGQLLANKIDSQNFVFVTTCKCVNKVVWIKKCSRYLNNKLVQYLNGSNLTILGHIILCLSGSFKYKHLITNLLSFIQ